MRANVAVAASVSCRPPHIVIDSCRQRERVRADSFKAVTAGYGSQRRQRCSSSINSESIHIFPSYTHTHNA